ncbi:MAG: hypothetical protein ACYS1C_03700 [Planctomycetota bacterium]|jgi:hypothetical protein
MAKEEEYLSYEQVLQELQIDRSRLNQLIREGRLGEHVMEGETKFRRVEAEEVKKTLEKRPTVMEEAEPAQDSDTDLLDEGAAPVSGEPETEILEEEEGGEPETDLLGEATAPSVVERDTEILEEEPFGDEFALEPVQGEEAELGKALSEEPSASETAMETELDLDAVAAAEAAAMEEEEEEIFDFSGALGEEEVAAEEGLAPEEPGLEMVDEEEEDLVTDILELGGGEEVPEEDLLSEIMEIQEEQEVEMPPAEERDETEDITAEITTLEEPTYEESELGEVLEAAEEVEFEEELEEGEEFVVPAPEPLGAAVEEVSGLWVGVLIATIVLMLLGMLFVVENGSRPEFSTHLTGWARAIFGS